jgi:hypothetical protein
MYSNVLRKCADVYCMTVVGCTLAGAVCGAAAYTVTYGGDSIPGHPKLTSNSAKVVKETLRLGNDVMTGAFVGAMVGLVLLAFQYKLCSI